MQNDKEKNAKKSRQFYVNLRRLCRFFELQASRYFAERLVGRPTFKMIEKSEENSLKKWP